MGEWMEIRLEWDHVILHYFTLQEEWGEVIETKRYKIKVVLGTEWPGVVHSSLWWQQNKLRKLLKRHRAHLSLETLAWSTKARKPCKTLKIHWSQEIELEKKKCLLIICKSLYEEAEPIYNSYHHQETALGTYSQHIALQFWCNSPFVFHTCDNIIKYAVCLCLAVYAFPR